MSDGSSSAVALFKNVVLILFILLVLVLAKPFFHSIYASIDHNVVTKLLQNVVKEGENDKLYGVDQIYSYVQKGLDQNKVKLNAKDIIKADNAGSYVVLTLDYRVDNKIFGDLNLSSVYHQSFRVNLK